MSFGSISVGLGAAAQLLPLLFDTVSLAKAIMNLVKADKLTDTDIENIDAKFQRLVERAQTESNNWGSTLGDLRKWIDEERAKENEI